MKVGGKTRVAANAPSNEVCRRKFHIWVTHERGEGCRRAPRSFAYVDTSVIAGPRPCTPSHNARDALCMLHTLLTIRKITVGSASLSVCRSSRERARLHERERERVKREDARTRVFSSTRGESTRARKRLRSTRLSRRRRIIFLSPRCALFRRVHRRVHHRPPLYASMRSEIRFLLSQSRCKLIKSERERDARACATTT